MTDVAELDAEGDLVVGADGRQQPRAPDLRGGLRREVVPRGCKYVSFGTDIVLDAFTFIFKQTEAGLVQVHAYPFDEHTSTWIIECPEHRSRPLGSDQMDEAESLRACEALFATSSTATAS